MSAPLSISTEEIGLRLPRRAESARGVIATRRAVSLRVSGGGASGSAEAAPLEGLSNESLGDVARALGDLRCRASDDPLGDAARALPGGPSAARFALEAALLDRAGRLARRPVAALLGARGTAVGFVALVDSIADAPERAAAAVRAGALGVKVKVGRRGREREEAAALRAIRRALGSAAIVRADANGALPASGPLVDALAEIGVDYVEEPFSVDRLLAAGALPFDVALDESVPRDPARCLEAVRDGRAVALVIKPTRLGIGGALEIGRRARRMGGRAVVGHLFEPPRAFAALAHVALAIDGAEVHGLAPYEGLRLWRTASGDALSAAASWSAGAVDVAEAEGLG